MILIVPLLQCFFCGQTRVGKTELTKALVESYFGSIASMIRLDMSEYMEQHIVSKMIVSLPGYVGYGEGGTLTEVVRRRPFNVILLDEIEKVHPNIFNILLQIFEDKRLSNSQGRRVSFKNIIIIMTSNIGSKAIINGRSNGTFGFGENDGDKHRSLKALVNEKVKAYFRPELLNRMDEVVIFHSLQKKQVCEILGLMLKETREQLACARIGLQVSEAIFNLTCKEGYDRRYGARSLKQALTRLVEDVVSEAFLSDNYQAGDTTIFYLDASRNPFVTY